VGERRRRGAQRVELIHAQSADEPEWAPLPATPVAAPPSPPTRRRAWIVLAAVGAIVGIVVGANVIGGPDDRRAAPPTTVLASTTTAAPTTAPSSTPPTGSGGSSGATSVDPTTPVVVADPPPGYAVAQAARFELGPDETDGQLWTTWGTDQRAGTWVAITAWPTDEPGMTTGTSRVWLSTGVGVVTRHADGTIALDAQRAGHHVTVLANRLDLSALAAVMDTVEFSGDHLSGSAAVAGLGLRLANESTAASPSDAPRRQMSSIGLASTSDPQQWIQIVTGRSLGTFDRAMRSFLLRDPTAIVVGGGHLATFGIDGRVPDVDMPIAIVDVDGQEVELSGGSSVRDLMNVAATLRTGTADDWQALVDESTSLHSPHVSSSELSINDGRTRTGISWRAELIVTEAQPTQVVAAFEGGSPAGQYAVSDVSGAAALATPDTPGIQAFASAGGVVLVAHVGRDQPGAELRVAVADGSYHSTVTDPGPAAPALFAAAGFSELASYHAELVGAGGVVLASLDDT
jgi:hypothetical protein